MMRYIGMLFHENWSETSLKNERSFQPALHNSQSEYTPVSENCPHEKAYRCTASLTVECALILPLMLSAVLALLLVLDLYGSVTVENLRLSNTARKTAVLASAAPDAPSSWIDLRKK